MPTDREQLDELVKNTNSYDESINDLDVIKELKKWKWGKYGWTSPVNLIITATWYKYFHPNQDICKIWATDQNGNKIEGGYSIRSEDESVTVPIFAKYDLCSGFCSPNSGMQGSRAIEKMRGHTRLNDEFGDAQKTVFDLQLFARILNQINRLDHKQLLEVLKYLIVLAKNNKTKRDEANATILKETSSSFNVIDFLSNTSDPELTKCVFAACFEAIYAGSDFTLEGVEDYKTAADERAEKPGDLSFSKNSQYKIAIEVKDKTQSIDWNNIERANKIIDRHDSLSTFIFALENRDSTVTDVVREMIRSEQIKSKSSDKITIISLHDAYKMALATCSEEKLVKRIGELITMAPAIKPETKEKWIEQNKKLNPSK